MSLSSYVYQKQKAESNERSIAIVSQSFLSWEVKSLRLLLFGGTILLLIVLVFVFRGRLVATLVNWRLLPKYFSDPSFNYEAFQNLKLENKSLQAELDSIQPKNSTAAGRYSYIVAQVYSRYPFNNLGTVIIDKGSLDGLSVNQPVLAANDIILGEIKKVSRTQSEVETVFDPSWRESVKIGVNGGEALLVGGLNPHLELIAKNATVNIGDSVTNLSPDFPLGYLLGSVKDAARDQMGNWQNAAIVLPYGLDALNQIFVVSNFP